MTDAELARIAELRQKLEVLEAEKAKLCEGVFTMWDALTEARAFSARGAGGEPWHGANTALRKSGDARVIATDAREAREHRRPQDLKTSSAFHAERGGQGDPSLAAAMMAPASSSEMRESWVGELAGRESGQPLVDAKCERCGSEECIGRDFPDRCAARLDLGSNFRAVAVQRSCARDCADPESCELVHDEWLHADRPGDGDL